MASHANPQGLYMTVTSLLVQLRAARLEYEIIVAADGGSEYRWELFHHVRPLLINTGSPQGTRDAGIRAARARHVLVIEDHVVVDDIVRLLDEHKRLGGAMTFAARLGEGPSLFNVYGTNTDWAGRLWFKETLYTRKHAQPYRVPQFGHSCFIVDRQKYIDVGGYGDTLSGWGGEEPMLSLKFWMLGHELWLVPYIGHYHFLADRTGGAMFTDAFKKNFAIVKYVIAGRVEDGLQLTPQLRAERARIEAGPFGGDINKLQDHMRAKGIN